MRPPPARQNAAWSTARSPTPPFTDQQQGWTWRELAGPSPPSRRPGVPVGLAADERGRHRSTLVLVEAQRRRRPPDQGVLGARGTRHRPRAAGPQVLHRSRTVRPRYSVVMITASAVWLVAEPLSTTATFSGLGFLHRHLLPSVGDRQSLVGSGSCVPAALLSRIRRPHRRTPPRRRPQGTVFRIRCPPYPGGPVGVPAPGGDRLRRSDRVAPGGWWTPGPLLHRPAVRRGVSGECPDLGGVPEPVVLPGGPAPAQRRALGPGRPQPRAVDVGCTWAHGSLELRGPCGATLGRRGLV